MLCHDTTLFVRAVPACHKNTQTKYQSDSCYQSKLSDSVVGVLRHFEETYSRSTAVVLIKKDIVTACLNISKNLQMLLMLKGTKLTEKKIYLTQTFKFVFCITMTLTNLLQNKRRLAKNKSMQVAAYFSMII